MLKLIFAFAVAASLASQVRSSSPSTQTGVPTSCQADTEALMRLAPDKFDQDPGGGWRRLTATPGCEGAIADLLARYRAVHWGTFQEIALHMNYWHEGQARALAGQTEKAIPLLLAGVDPHMLGGFSDYALATVAFLQNDREALKAARDRLAAVPRPVLTTTGEWPPNLKIVDSLIKCFGQSYARAYSQGCR